MRLLSIFIVFAASMASASDFRTLDIGDSCDLIPAREEALASARVPWNAPAEEIYAFHGNAFDRNLLFTYFCQKGRLFSGNYYFPVEAADKIKDTYDDIHIRLTSLYGPPFVDSSDANPDARQRVPGVQMTTWRTPRINVTMSLQANLPREEPGQRLFVVVSKRN